MISADVKADVKQQEIKELVAISCTNFSQEATSKLEMGYSRKNQNRGVEDILF